MNTLFVSTKKHSWICCFMNDNKIRLKQVILPLLLFLMLLILNVAPLSAQDLTVNNFKLNLHLKNMHLWQGSIVTPGVMMATSMEYVTDDQKLVVGLWGGASFDASYKEFSYYSTYNFTRNFQAQLISHNNYSNMAKPDMFSYDKYTSPNFLDLVLSYTISDDIPLTALWSTILFGQAGDYDVSDDGSVTDSYSSYVELNYRLFEDDNTQIKACVGGAFALATEKTFYSNSPSIVNIGLTLTREVKLLNKNIPVSSTAFWNPDSGLGALQIDIMLF